jgi:hypothetical protein
LAEGQMTHQQIADKFGVSRPHVTKINRRHKWREE